MSTQAQAMSVQAQIVVEAPIERAFRVFTEDFDKVKQDSERDYYMSAAEAKEYGIIDEVLTAARTPIATR